VFLFTQRHSIFISFGAKGRVFNFLFVAKRKVAKKKYIFISFGAKETKQRKRGVCVAKATLSTYKTQSKFAFYNLTKCFCFFAPNAHLRCGANLKRIKFIKPPTNDLLWKSKQKKGVIYLMKNPVSLI